MKKDKENLVVYDGFVNEDYCEIDVYMCTLCGEKDIYSDDGLYPDHHCTK